MSQLTFPTAPGVTVNVSAATGGSGGSSPNAAVFMVGIADRGPFLPVQVLDFLDYQAKFGTRSAGSAVLSDSVELAFGEGASTVYVNRVTGPAPTKGTLALVDRAGSPLLTMTVSAAFYGSDSTKLSVGITAGTVANSFDLSVYDTASPTPTVAVENFRDNTSVANAVAAINAAANGSAYITAVDNASASSGVLALPALIGGVGTALSAGSDDRVNANDTTWNAAASAFTRGLGGGTLLAPGRYASSFHLLLQAAATYQKREAILDGPPTPVVSDLTTLSLADSVGQGAIDLGDAGMGFSPWVTMPPAPGGSVSRVVPASAAVAGLIARTDAVAGHSNQAAMGAFGNLQYATGLSQAQFLPSERATINGRQGTSGWNVLRQPVGARPQVFGFRTVSAASRAYFGANVRETLTLDRDIDLIGEGYVGRMIDGQGYVFIDLANDIGLRLRRDYDAKALFGATASNAYGVDVGPTVNTPQSIAAGIIRARVFYVPSPTGEKVVIDLVRQSVPTS